ncbi:hypothetical protein O3M35_001243 [Rhynocoris fuscipes]|uniref:F-box domain-containing protein n=1 Tax=Rhynocoris fuscipes TaxID=488301 RepID=A0AAW1DR12_9HEMI
MDFIQILPIEILEEIFLFLDSIDLIRCSCVSYRWREVVNSNKIWSKRCAVEKILHKPYLKKEDSLFTNPMKMYKTSDSISNRLTPTCHWRSHFNRYMYVKKNWRIGHYTMLRTKVKTSHYKEGMLINIEDSRISVHLVPESLEVPFYIEKRHKFTMVDNLLLKDGHIIYTQARYVACYKRQNNEFNLIYEFDVEKSICEGQPTRNHADRTLTAAVSDQFLLIQDNQNPCYLRFYHFTKGTLLKELSMHSLKALQLGRSVCPNISCLQVMNDKVYISYSIANKHLISQYNFNTDKWGITFDTHLRTIEIVSSNNFLCAKMSDMAFEKSCELSVWSLHTKLEIALFCTNKNLPVILTQDGKIIYSEQDTIYVRGLVQSFEKEMDVSSRLDNMCLVWDKMLLVNLGCAIQLWDWVSGVRLHTFIRDAISNVWADDKLIVVSISRFINSYSPAGGYIIAFW